MTLKRKTPEVHFFCTVHKKIIQFFIHYNIDLIWLRRSRVKYQNFHLSSTVIFFSAGRIRPTNFTAMAIWSGKGIKKYECPETYFEEYATKFLHSFRNVWSNREFIGEFLKIDYEDLFFSLFWHCTVLIFLYYTTRHYSVIGKCLVRARIFVRDIKFLIFSIIFKGFLNNLFL